jgi:hypothetical protein
MELINYLKLIRQYAVFILICSLTIAALAYLVSDSISSGYKKSQTYFLKIENINQIDKANELTDTVVAVIQSDEFKQESAAFVGSFSARKIAPQVVKITFTSQNESSLTLQTQIVEKAFNDKLKSLSQNPTEIQLVSLGAQNQIVKTNLNKNVLAIFGIIIGALFAQLVIIAKTYLKL